MLGLFIGFFLLFFDNFGIILRLGDFGVYLGRLNLFLDGYLGGESNGYGLKCGLLKLISSFY